MQRALLLLAALQLVLSGSWQTRADSLPPSTIISKQRFSAKAREHAHGGPLARRPRPSKEFVYVYDMPAKFTSDIKALDVEWHPEQYDYDQVIIQQRGTLHARQNAAHVTSRIYTKAYDKVHSMGRMMISRHQQHCSLLTTISAACSWQTLFKRMIAEPGAAGAS